MDGHTGKAVGVWLWGALALTQEEVLMLVVVRQVFQLLLAVLRREAETVSPQDPSDPRPPCSPPPALQPQLLPPAQRGFLFLCTLGPSGLPVAPANTSSAFAGRTNPKLASQLRRSASRAEARGQVTAHSHTRSGLAGI